MQNNAESRATGGFIGSYALMTAENGKIDVGDMVRTGNWNNVARGRPHRQALGPPRLPPPVHAVLAQDHAAEHQPVAGLPERV